MELVGKQVLNFTDKKTGELIQGIRLHFVAPDDNVKGQAAVTKFIRIDSPLYQKACDIPLGPFNIVFGRRDSVLDISEA